MTGVAQQYRHVDIPREKGVDVNRVKSWDQHRGIEGMLKPFQTYIHHAQGDANDRYYS